MSIMKKIFIIYYEMQKENNQLKNEKILKSLKKGWTI